MPNDHELEELDILYREKLARFDRGAVTRKKRYQALWTTITALTFLNMILAALGEHFDREAWFREGDSATPFNKTVLNVSLSVFGLTIIGLTVVQTTAGLQGGWLAYRGAAERLRRNCVLFRAGLPPFDGADREEVLRTVIAEICDVADRKDTASTRERFKWSDAVELLRQGGAAGTVPPSTPDRGLLGGPIRDEAEALDGRLRNQRLWYVRKSRGYLLAYVLMQTGIVMCSVVNVLHGLVLGERLFWLIVVSSIFSLGLIAFRDFLDWGPLFVRYFQTARNLGTIEETYLNRRHPFDAGDESGRLRTLLEQVEQTLASEFQYWIYTRR